MARFVNTLFVKFLLQILEVLWYNQSEIDWRRLMIHKLRSLILKYWDVLSYLFFGVLTTVVN